MKTLAGATLLVCVCAGLLFARATTAPAARQAKAPSVSHAVMQMERDWLAAEKAADVAKLGQIIADDWVGIHDAERMTKQSYLASVKSGATKIESFEMGPMEVKVLGNVAVVQGSDTEKSVTNGKDSSGKYVWMDVFVKRGGKWVAVRSQIATVK
jgi:ketosteroid isomerase-like protein